MPVKPELVVEVREILDTLLQVMNQGLAYDLNAASQAVRGVRGEMGGFESRESEIAAIEYALRLVTHMARALEADPSIDAGDLIVPLLFALAGRYSQLTGEPPREVT